MATAIIGIVLQLAGWLFSMLASPLVNGDSDGAGLLFSGANGPVFSLISLGAGVVMFLGAQKMKTLESYNWAMLASGVALVPGVSPCWLIGLPVGIWSIVILSKAEVKQSFGR
jgi:hypothetical protein